MLATAVEDAAYKFEKMLRNKVPWDEIVRSTECWSLFKIMDEKTRQFVRTEAKKVAERRIRTMGDRTDKQHDVLDSMNI